jgi:predicted RNA-binding protein with RPS1 domain
MSRRRRASSSVSLSPSSPRHVEVQGGGSKANDSTHQVTSIPQLGAIIRGIVTRIMSYGAFVKVPGYLDGLLHFSRISESKDDPHIDEASARRILKENEPIYAKVVLVGPGKFSLDIRFVDQEEGTDLDPSNEKRIRLEPAIAKGVWYDASLPDPEAAVKKVDVKINEIFKAVIVREVVYGVFVQIGNKVGLLPQLKFGTQVQSFKFGDKLFVKVVEVQKNGKFNCDARFVDQRTGQDLDPSHAHSEEKLVFNSGNTKEKNDERSISRKDNKTPRNNSRQGDRKRDRSDSPIRRRRDRSESVRRNRDRSDSPIRRRRDQSDRRDRSDSPIRRRRDRSNSRNRNNRLDKSDSPIRRRRDRSDSPDNNRRKRDRRSRSRSEEIIIRRR